MTSQTPANGANAPVSRIVVPSVLVAAVLGLGLTMCGGEPQVDVPAEKPAEAPAVEKEAPPAAVVDPGQPVPTLIVTQAQFGKVDGKPKPMPARLMLMRMTEGGVVTTSFEDPEANVFHKAIPWEGGLLTIGAERAPKPAHLKHWTQGDDGAWTGKVIWERAWDGSKYNRLRDLEVGDVDGDGTPELVLATHDRGVVAVGKMSEDGAWTFTEMHEAADTFVHEIEIGDVDGDGKDEFYSTPSARNRSSGVSQPGSVYVYTWNGTGFDHKPVVDYEESHAKEILVTDVDGDGTDELYVVREAHTIKGEDGKKKRVDPVRIVRYTPDGKGGYAEQVVATLDDDQCRFLVPGDVDGDGQIELVAAAYKKGLFVLEPSADGTFKTELIDADSSGFEHATHVADLDNDGKVEIYVAADDQKQMRRYVHNGSGYERTELGELGPSGRSMITWNVQDGVF